MTLSYRDSCLSPLWMGALQSRGQVCPIPTIYPGPRIGQTHQMREMFPPTPSPWFSHPNPAMISLTPKTSSQPLSHFIIPH